MAMTMLCDQVRLCDHPQDEDAMVVILEQLFKVPRGCWRKGDDAAGTAAE